MPKDQKLGFTLTGKGAQIYECQPVAGQPEKFAWVFKAPEAELADQGGRMVGRHYAGPTWELAGEGGKVVGKLRAKANAPGGKSIPWLLLDATQATGDLMKNVRTVRRIDTVGGLAPAETPTAAQSGKEVRVPYTATYQFFVAG